MLWILATTPQTIDMLIETTLLSTPCYGFGDRHSTHHPRNSLSFQLHVMDSSHMNVGYYSLGCQLSTPCYGFRELKLAELEKAVELLRLSTPCYGFPPYRREREERFTCYSILSTPCYGFKRTSTA